MAKLSDAKLLADFALEVHRYYIYENYSGPLNSLQEQALDRMPDRMGKVDVAGIAREISRAMRIKIHDLSGRDDEYNSPEQKDNAGWLSSIGKVDAENISAILRSHLEGKSE